MAVDGLHHRFSGLVADAESVGGRIKEIIAKAAEEINDLFGDDNHPAQVSIIQRLEQAAHLAVSSPALRDKPVDSEEAADPTPAGTAAVPAQDQATEETAGQPAEPTSTASSTESEGTSQS